MLISENGYKEVEHAKLFRHQHYQAEAFMGIGRMLRFKGAFWKRRTCMIFLDSE